MSFATSVLKGFMYGALIGGGASLASNINEPHYALLGSIFGTFMGVPVGAVYSILFPRVSEEIILEKEGWYISK